MSNLKRTLGAATLAALALLTAVPAMAQDLGAATGKTIELTPTRYGASVNAVGMARISVTPKGVETFGLVVSADVKDGIFYVVEVTTPKGVFKVADVEMFLGTGAVKQTNLTHATKAFPVANLQTITVRNRGGVLLSGQF